MGRTHCQQWFFAEGPRETALVTPRPFFASALTLIVVLAAQAPARAETPSDASPQPVDTLVGPVVVVGQADQGGPRISVTGANDYGTTAAEIANLPAGGNAVLTDVLLQMPGVALDQNQQIHVRDTEGPQFQYQINGLMVPLDINTNPPFLSMINPMFIKRLDLVDGVLPSRYSYATGGVVDIETKDGCEAPGGSLTLFGGQRETVQPSAQYGGAAGRFSYYVSGLYSQSDTAFSSATPGPNPIHDHTNQGQAFGVFGYTLDGGTRLSLILSTAASNNQLPNMANLPQQFTLAGAGAFQSANINSYLNFRDYLAMLSLQGELSPQISYQLGYSIHRITQDYLPDNAGELIFQGVASTASHRDFDNTLQGDLTYRAPRNTLSAGFYVGAYHVVVEDASLVFPADAWGAQTSITPISVNSNTEATNLLLGLYVNDLWKVTDRLTANFGLRWDGLTGFTNHDQINPTINFTYALDTTTTAHAGFARYMQVPSFQGISPGAPAAFAGTTAAGPPGVANPLTEDDYEWDGGVNHRLGRAVTVSADVFYEITDHYLDTGQFGVVPIFAPFNYQHGYIWGGELAVKYKADGLSTYANLTLGQNRQTGVATGQFNFDPDELAYINSHYIVLDHQPLVGVSSGAAYDWKNWSVSLDAIYSSGLRGGFADTTRLPQVIQVNAAIQHSWNVPRVGKVIDRLTLLNLFDRVNLIRPAEGIGIFQAAYGPRFTVLDSVTIPF
jgi:outer membrane cobalamin receptor